MSGQPVPSQLDQVLPRFYVQKAGPYHPFGRIRIAPFGKGGLRILAESGYTKTLDSRISAALSANGEASRDTLTALIAEANNSIRIANTVIETETPSLLDLDNDDPDRSRELIASNKLKIERLTLAIPQLQSRIGAIDAETALKTWNDEADRLREQSNKIYDELKALYPGFLQKMMDLFDQGKRNASAFQSHKRKAPPGADVWFDAATPHSTFWIDIQLPSWTKPHVTFPLRQTPEQIAWAQQVAFTNAMCAQTKAIEAKHAQMHSPDWAGAYDEIHKRKAEADAKAEQELKQKDLEARQNYYLSLQEAERKRMRGEV